MANRTIRTPEKGDEWPCTASCTSLLNELRANAATLAGAAQPGPPYAVEEAAAGLAPPPVHDNDMDDAVESAIWKTLKHDRC